MTKASEEDTLCSENLSSQYRKLEEEWERFSGTFRRYRRNRLTHPHLTHTDYLAALDRKAEAFRVELEVMNQMVLDVLKELREHHDALISNREKLAKVDPSDTSE